MTQDCEIDLYPLAEGDVLTAQHWVEMRHHAVLGSRWRAVMTATPEAGFFGFLLWMEAMRQDPAGTLPDNDEELCHLAGLGCDLVRWRALRAGPHGGPLYGWEPCLVERPDGAPPLRRLQHRVVGEIATRAFGRLRKHAEERGEATRRNRISRLRRHCAAIGVRRTTLQSEVFCDRVLAALDAAKLPVSLANVRRAVEQISSAETAEVIDFKPK